MNKRSGYYINIANKDIFIVTSKYYIKDKDVRNVMLRLNLFDLSDKELYKFKESLARAWLYIDDNNKYKIKIKKERLRDVNDLMIIYRDS